MTSTESCSGLPLLRPTSKAVGTPGLSLSIYAVSHPTRLPFLLSNTVIAIETGSLYPEVISPITPGNRSSSFSEILSITKSVLFGRSVSPQASPEAAVNPTLTSEADPYSDKGNRPESAAEEKIELPKSTGTEINENDFVAEILEDDTAIITRYNSYEDECEGIPGEISGHTVVGIGKNAFSYKKFEDLVIPAAVLVIGESAFSNTEIDGSIDLSGLQLIDDNAFFAAELPGEISIPDNAYVGEQAFGYCEKLEKVTLGRNVTLDDEAFCYAELSDLAVSSGDIIGGRSFFSCPKLKTVSDSGKGGNLEGSIEKQAFAYCDSMESVSIPSYITTIAEEAFCYSKIDNGITFEGKVDIGDKAFFSSECGATIEIPSGSTIAEQSFAYSAKYEDLIIGDDVTIDDEAFCYTSDVKRATIGKNVIIGDSAFFSSSLEELTVGSGSEIGKEAFAYSADIKTKNIDSDVKTRDDSFYYAGE